MVFDFYKLLTDSLVYFAVAFTLAICLLAFHKTTGRKESEPVAFFLVHGTAALLTGWLCGSTWVYLIACAMGVISRLTARLLADFSVTGRLLVATNILLTLVGTVWGFVFVVALDVSALTKGLMLAGYPLVVLTLPIGLLQALEQWEVLIRERWHRPGAALPVTPRSQYPKICLQVPCYAEPPELVIETLNALAGLRYPNFQVMVIDNNTRDPDLWKPLEAHCKSLGDRFRFFHVENLAGAKAGALNYAMGHTDADVEIIGVVDSDYLAEPDFLASLVGYFDDSQIGFVQTPHDYRDWESSLYQKMCYWEYRGFFMTTMMSLNERDAGLTVGTMCLIRRRALEVAGGWAEWCQTEDSELSIRIHAAGYSSVYVPQTFGRGLIPETFADYKKQRFRWTCGPVQEFKRHLPLFLPRPFAVPSALTPFQKLHHLNHGLGPFSTGLGFMLAPVGLAVVASMLMQQEVITVPAPLWVVSFTSLISGWVLTSLVYCGLMKATVGEMLGALTARQALAHTALMASVWGVLTGRIPWRRTNKFKSLPSGLVALRSAQIELGIGLVLLGSAAALYFAFKPVGLSLLLVVGIVIQSFSYFCAPFLALLAEHDLRAQQPQNRPVRPAWVSAGLATALAFGLVFVVRPGRTPQPQVRPTGRPAQIASRPRATIAAVSVATPKSPDLRAAPGPDALIAMNSAPSRTALERRPSVTRSFPRVKPQAGSVLDPGLVSAPTLEESEVPSGVALLTDQPRMAELVSWSPPAGTPDCYETAAKTYDYRCRNRKN